MMRNRRHSRGFTLTELLLAVLVLLVVIAATARIFGTAQRVASLGEANAAILQEAGAIERQLRDDLSKLSPDGYLVIRNFAVRNDINKVGSGQAVSLNPDLPDGAIIRLDQLVFFTRGSRETEALIGGVNLGDGSVPAATVSRVTYGHSVQIKDPLAGPSSSERFDPSGFTFTYDDNGPVRPLLPFAVDSPADGSSLTMSSAAGGATKKLSATQPGARDWILGRRAILIADDGGEPTLLGFEPGTAQVVAPNAFPCLTYQPGTPPNLVPPNALIALTTRPAVEYLHGRIDACAQQINDIEIALGRYDYVASGVPTSLHQLWAVVPGVIDPPIAFLGTQDAQWHSVRQRLLNSVFGPNYRITMADLSRAHVGLTGWPRIERQSPSTARQDQALTTGMLSGHCSSFIVEWCWEPGVGRVNGPNGLPASASDPFGGGSTSLLGFQPRYPSRCWIGMPDRDPESGLQVPTSQQRGARTLGQQDGVEAPIYIPSIEGPRFRNAPLATAVIPVQAPPQIPAPTVAVPGGFCWVYASTFGFNGSQPTTSQIDPATGSRTQVPRLDYTPRPTAIRITMTLHDPDRRIEGGREFTFVIDLPEVASP